MEPMHPDWQGKLTLGALPLPLFANGHGYFVQSAHTRLGVAPFAVHATYTLDRHDGLAKRQRFREAGLWSADPISPPTERFLVLNSSVPPAAAAAIRLFKAKGESANNIGVHRLALMGYLTELRDAIALARALGRTLILPRHQCFCDRLWAGSDDILRFGCMYPGSQDHPFLPFACPMDHWLVPHVWERSGLAFRDAIFIERLLSAEPRTSVRDMRIVPAAEWHRACAAKAQARFAGVVGDCWDVLPAGLWTAEEMRAHLHATGSARNAQDGATRVLRLEHSRSLLCGVSSNPTETSQTNRLLGQLLRIPPWCARCPNCDERLRQWQVPPRSGRQWGEEWCLEVPPPPLFHAGRCVLSRDGTSDAVRE